jgi:hypothetical protein
MDSQRSDEMKEALAPLRIQIKQEILTELQAKHEERFSTFQRDLDTTLAQYMVNIQMVTTDREVKMSAFEARTERKIADLETVVASGLEDIRNTKQSLVELADELEDRLKQAVEPTVSSSGDNTALHRQLDGLRKGFQHIVKEFSQEKAARACSSFGGEEGRKFLAEVKVDVSKSISQIRKEFEDALVQNGMKITGREGAKNPETVIAALREEVRFLREAAHKTPDAKDDGSTQFPSDASESTVSSLEERKGKEQSPRLHSQKIDSTNLIKSFFEKAGINNRSARFSVQGASVSNDSTHLGQPTVRANSEFARPSSEQQQQQQQRGRIELKPGRKDGSSRVLSPEVRRSLSMQAQRNQDGASAERANQKVQFGMWPVPKSGKLMHMPAGTLSPRVSVPVSAPISSRR